VSVLLVHRHRVYQATKAVNWALVYFGVFSGRHPDINYKHIRQQHGVVEGLHPSYPHCGRGHLGLKEITQYSPHAKPIWTTLALDTISENVKAKH